MTTAIWFNPHINNALRLTTAMALALALGFTLDQLERVVLAMLVLPGILVSSLDLPSAHWRRRGLLGVLGFAISSGLSATIALYLPNGLPLWFALLGFFMASCAAWGELAGKLGMGVLTLGVIGLATASLYPAWQLALGFGLAAFWLLLFSALWYRLWRQLPLRQSLAATYARLSNLMAERPEQLQQMRLAPHFDDALSQQLQSSRRQLAAVQDQPGIAPLRNAFVAAVDLQERLQALPEPALASSVLTEPKHLPLYRRWTQQIAQRLAQLSRDLESGRDLRSGAPPSEVVDKLTQALRADAGPDRRGLVARYMADNAERITRLAYRAAPLFQREFLPVEERSPWQQWRQMMRWSSPVGRGAARLALILAAAMLIAEQLPLENGYWILSTIIMVRQSSFVATRSRVWQRAFGTLGGIALAGVWLQLGLAPSWSLILVLCLLPLTLTLVQIHHGWTTVGATLVLMLALDVINMADNTVLLARMMDTVIGCLLIYLAYRFLWPQWQGGRQAQLRRTALATLHRYLQRVLQGLADAQPATVELARARRLAYEQGVALTASLAQMRQEPGYADSANSSSLLAIYKGAMGHLNVLVPQLGKESRLSEEELSRLRRLFDQAYASLIRAIDGRQGDIEPLTQEQRWLQELLADASADRRGFALYQLSLYLERYFSMVEILKASPPERRSR
ncbi:FUSC family membrane protein [Ferrimonas marina]|uniref:Uncharacterized membrane protein YccC n=1 Tax=Ferrimonas marina TaxID=299255 RepID=A0A1M5V8I4_9GAMM|nr:FUSC family membrane protein [Ferrimonas marina]SHH71569.1 Uncharacterized membrane protein YccC [Ferrimonas marina]